MYYVYLLLCADKSIYTGIAKDVKRRFQEHQQGIGARYTRSHPVQKILRVEKYPTRSAALKREAEIKSWPRAKKLELVKTGAENVSR